ncbi:MAG: Imidazolonepropionase [Clostridiales bacterium 38_11]|nr:MAG: Imidazolonepropionase [Clostridiales bacterium 38_11]HBH13259.1 imidazolonepropionase [Clostridiales bacterium]
MSKKVILNSSEVVTCSGFEAKSGTTMMQINPIKNGAILIQDGYISMVGTETEVLKTIDLDDYEIIDAKGNTVMPGFVDSHTHFIFGGYRAEEFSWRLRGDSYMDIMERGGGIVSSVRSTRESTLAELVTVGNKRLDSMIKFGVTTVEGKSGYGLDKATEIKQLEAMRILKEKRTDIDIATTFLGPHAVEKQYKGKEDDFIDLQISEVLPIVIQKNLAEFADIFCEKNVFTIEQSRRFLLAAKGLGLKLKIHADEIVQLGGAELAAELGAISADHLLQASDFGISQLAAKKVIATLLPATAFSLKTDYANARKMINSNCAVALSTDLNPGSCFSNSIPLIISLAALYMDMRIEEIITSLTINGAAALSRERETGSIDVGKKADIIILDFPSYHFLPYHIGMNIVKTVIKSGNIVAEN